MIYRIEIFHSGNLANTYTRKRRDAAALLYERMVHMALSSNGLLDRKAARTAMTKARIAYNTGTVKLSIPVIAYTITFEKVA